MKDSDPVKQRRVNITYPYQTAKAKVKSVENPTIEIPSGINIEDIGREAFENTCKKIFGEGFKDDTDQAPNGVNGSIGRILDRIATAKRNNDTELTNQAINDFVKALRENGHPFDPWEPKDEEEDDFPF